MKYPKEYLDEIKTRLKVSTVVSKSVSLKRRGKEFVGLSPFKNEKTPSFTVNDEKEFYHCFASGEHGNIFDFLMKTQNLKFGEVVKTLANLAGMRPYLFSKKDEEREKKFKEYTSILSKYSEICHEIIIKNKSLMVSKYLSKRNLNESIITKYKLGYSLYDDNLFEKFKKLFSEDSLKDSGLFYFDERKNKFIDRFRNRLIFPINNISGRPIGLGGRIIEQNNYLAKYINSPETPFFKKGSNLYNLDIARKLSNKSEKIYIVEGYMDVIGLSKNGIDNVVANLGTALTEKQIEILNQFFSHIIICFDSDDSGYKAAVKAAENNIINLKPDKKISFLFLPDGEDPDSFVNKNGKEFFQNYAQNNLIPVHELIFNTYKNDNDNSPSSLAIFEKKLRSLANSIKDELIKKYILEFFLEKVREFTPNISKNKSKFYFKKEKSLDITQKHYNESKSIKPIEIKEYSFLCLIIKNLKFFVENSNLIKDVKLFTKENVLVFEKLFDEIENKNVQDLKELSIDKQILDKILKFSSIKYLLNDDNIDQEKIEVFLDEIKRDLKHHELELRIEELEAKFSKDFNENTFNELKELKKLQKIN